MSGNPHLVILFLSLLNVQTQSEKKSHKRFVVDDWISENKYEDSWTPFSIYLVHFVRDCRSKNKLFSFNSDFGTPLSFLIVWSIV